MVGCDHETGSIILFMKILDFFLRNSAFQDPVIFLLLGRSSPMIAEMLVPEVGWVLSPMP